MKKYFLSIVGGLSIAMYAGIINADVSGNWVFSVTLGDLGSGDAAITMNEEADGELSGTYSGQLANGPIRGTYDGDNFEFSFSSDLLGTDITYSGAISDEESGSGVVQAGGTDIGTFTARKAD